MKKEQMRKILGNQKPLFAFRDADRDNTANILDCKPYNPKEQGVTHKIGAWAARKAGKEEWAERIEKREERVEEVKEARKEERQQQALETAKYKEKVRGERQRTFVERGGYKGLAIRGAKSLAVGVRAGPGGVGATRRMPDIYANLPDIMRIGKPVPTATVRKTTKKRRRKKKK